jgi:hypothetical protein
VANFIWIITILATSKNKINKLYLIIWGKIKNFNAKKVGYIL